MNQNTENQNHPELDGPLEAAVWAVLSEPVPAAAVERVKQRASEISGDSPQVIQHHKPRKQFSTLLRFALAASVMAIVVGGFTLLDLSVGSNNVYAQVAQRLQQLKSMVCYVQFSESGMLDDNLVEDQAGIQKVTYLAPSFHRIEYQGAGTVQIVNREQNRNVLLMPSAKQAIVADGASAVAMDMNSPVRLVEALMRHFQVDRAGESGVTSLGTRTVANETLQGYESTIGRETVRAWFDAKTFVPAMVAVRFEIPAHMANGNAVPMWQVMSGIEVDVAVSRELFDTDVPRDYETLSLDAPRDQTPATLDDVIEMLRLCAAANGSQFPLSLSINDEVGTPLAIQNKLAETVEDQLAESDQARKAALMERLQEFGEAVGRATAFQFSIEAGNDWNYFGGAKLGETERPILWYSPAADGNYKVVYGDLSVKDVAKGNLPPKPQSLTRQSTPKKSIRVSTPAFTLPRSAIHDYTALEQIRKDGTQSKVEFLNLGGMPEFSESQVKKIPGENVVLQEVDPKWKPDRTADSSRFAFLREFTNLEGLDLSHLYLNQADLDVIARCTKLRRLSLSGVQIFDSASRRLNGDDLAKLSNLKSLELLDLSQSNFIGGLRHLKDLPRLHTLYLRSFEHLNDASVAELSVLPNLETLVLAPVYATNPDATVTENGLKSLQDCRRLRTLYVGYHGKWTLPIDRLRELLPQVDVRSPEEGLPAAR
ncbi:hypothetical protein NHH03_22765 [Stieleria sp. TO1_6]|uniref:hypothetical protein n=1 Tax=Stieleria tagensis TaxID=2956795 RepID=UPI00209B9954|nr:hypothetical protein [Stieleria tagensis]MCO8124579.1 hypothetical protein [Stieleria tagensis]